MIRTRRSIALAAFGSLRVSNVRYFAALPAVLALAFIWPFGGGKKIHMTPSSQVPAAQEILHVMSTNNGNMQLDIEVHSLAHPNALTPPEQSYVVWVQPSGEAPINKGALQVDGNQLGELKTVTPYKNFKVFITAEKYAQLRSPEGPTVLSANVQS